MCGRRSGADRRYVLGVTIPEWAGPLARRWPAVAGVTVAALAPVAWRVGLSPALPAFCYLVVVGVALAFVDVTLKRLPDPLTLPSYAVAAVLLGGAAALGPDGGVRFRHALIGMAALFLLYAAPWIVAPGHMGAGDVKLAGVLGMYLGWLGLPAWLLGACAGFVLAALYSLALLASRRAGLRSSIPFGPFMLLGALVAVLVRGG
jgi:leader peptidase (prepilin peptidase) / N-methyltransferase